MDFLRKNPNGCSQILKIYNARNTHGRPSIHMVLHAHTHTHTHYSRLMLACIILHFLINHERIDSQDSLPKFSRLHHNPFFYSYDQPIMLRLPNLERPDHFFSIYLRTIRWFLIRWTNLDQIWIGATMPFFSIYLRTIRRFLIRCDHQIWRTVRIRLDEYSKRIKSGYHKKKTLYDEFIICYCL